MHRPRLLTGLLLLTLTAGCLSLKAEPVRDFQYALQIDSLAEISFAEGDMRGCISLWLEAAEIADRYAASEQDSLTYSGFLQSLGVCYRRISMMDSTLYYYNRAWDIIQDKTSDPVLLQPGLGHHPGQDLPCGRLREDPTAHQHGHPADVHGPGRGVDAVRRPGNADGGA